MSATHRIQNTIYSLLLSLICVSSFAENSGLLVSTSWLAERIDDPNLVILHIGKEKDFAEGHIPGARQLDVVADFAHPNSQTYSADSLYLELPEIAQLEAKLESVGISNDSTLVLYWPGDTITSATRALFTLDWAGLGKQSYLLNGGLDAWKKANYQLSTDISPITKGDLTLTVNADLIATAEWVKEHGNHPGVGLVDARPKAFFDGVSSYQSIKGHIHGAGSTPWTAFVDNDLQLHDKATLEKILADGGVQTGDVVVAYCHIGQFATMALLAARTLGHDVKLYDGAFQDWAQKGLPVETAAQE